MPPIPKSRFFLLDTCIAEYLLKSEMHTALIEQLNTWAGEKFKLAISKISYAELIDGAYKDKIDEIKDLLDKYTQFEVSQRVLTGSALLANVYKTQDKKTNGASLADKIIAATAFIYNLPVVTADVKDFPHPFFISIASKNLKYKKKSKEYYQVIDLLKPNYEILNFWFNKTK